jgi:hypothetical protein
MLADALLNLPSCEFRKCTDVDHHFVCLHNRVRVAGGRVTSEVCKNCTARILPAIPHSSSTTNTHSQTTRRSRPNHAQRAWNLAASVRDFISDGCRTVSKDEFEERLKVCDSCEFRNANSCTQCGCRLNLKARGRAFRCPVNRWPELG